jgi:hypothetical protein
MRLEKGDMSALSTGIDIMHSSAVDNSIVTLLF